MNDVKGKLLCTVLLGKWHSTTPMKMGDYHMLAQRTMGMIWPEVGLLLNWPEGVDNNIIIE